MQLHSCSFFPQTQRSFLCPNYVTSGLHTVGSGSPSAVASGAPMLAISRTAEVTMICDSLLGLSIPNNCCSSHQHISFRSLLSHAMDNYTAFSNLFPTPSIPPPPTPGGAAPSPEILLYHIIFLPHLICHTCTHWYSSLRPSFTAASTEN